ncbi:MAG: hypothetical protein AAGU27_00070 [Dehalobacterium sp.]
MTKNFWSTCLSAVKLKGTFDEDVQELVTNRTHVLYYFPGDKLQVKSEQVDKLVGKDVTQGENNQYKAMQSGKSRKNTVGKEIFGFPFTGIDSPVWNLQGEIIDCMGLEKDYQIEVISLGLATTLEQVNARIGEVASGS